MSAHVFKHLTGHLDFWYYQAPPKRWHQPRTLEKNIEEIEVIVSGRGYFDVKGKIVDAGPGSSLWYQPGDCVMVTAHEKDPYETIVFRFEVTARSPLAPPPYSTWADAGECARFCRRALDLFRQGADRSPEVAVCHYARLIWEAEEYRRRGGERQLPSALRRALSILETRYAESLDVECLAREAGVSASHLHLLFRRHLGSSPLQCLINQRLLKAQDELSRSDQSVKEICFAVGFRDFAYFCARFKQRTNLTPTAYRQRFAARG